MINLFYIIFWGFIVVSISWYFHLFRAYRWIIENRNYQSVLEEREVFFIIPLLDEASRIEKTAEYFIKTFGYLKKLHIVLVTAEKENEVFRAKTKNLLSGLKLIKSEKGIRDYLKKTINFEITSNRENAMEGITIEAERAICERENTVTVVKKLEEKYKEIELYHYPYIGGKMAHHLNYSIRCIIKKGVDDNALFAIYNADSRPHQKTFDWIFYALSRNKIRVFQQYGNYLKNMHKFKGLVRNTILTAAALWQTRWSIGFEIFNALKQFRRKKRNNLNNPPLNYCIGHGLIFTKDIFLKLDGFNEKMHNEDAIFGLELSYYQELIMPVPYFDEADTPDTIKSLYLQKSSWFFGPLQSFEYYKKLVEKIKNINKFKLFVLSAKLFSHALYWILVPTFLVLSFFLACAERNSLLFTLFFIELILFLIVPNFFTWMIIKKENNKHINNKYIIYSLLFGSVPCYILHGLSAYKGLFQAIFYYLFKKTINKKKTEMLD